ncbi:MAG: stage III sporulation protein AA [Clostridia bacterium]|nr:stage III sporulation protein AA [Clostridia bacterium]
MENTKSFNSAIASICPRLKNVLEYLPQNIKYKTEEIRIRNGLPVALTIGGKPVYITTNGGICEYISKDLLKAGKTDLEESFMLLCKRSVYAHTAELKEGYIVMDNGHRAGICGTLTEDGHLRDVSSINIRIAHEVIGCADSIIKEFDGGGFLIAGPPGSGKTTLLRDFIRQLSTGITGKYKKISVIDSRGEISGSSFGNCANNLGENTDILIIKDKALGMEIAVRTLFPDIVAFDEIGNNSELMRVLESFNAGVCVVTTAHAGSIKDLTCRSITKALINSGAISKIALLPPNIGEPMEIFSAQQLKKYAAY